jgi:hypothetical protein
MRKTILISILLIITAIIYYTGFYVAQPYGASYNRVQNALAQYDSISAITLGNSHSGSIDWQSVEFPGKGYNLHDGFFDIFEMLYVAEVVIPKLTSVEYVFIAVPYYFFEFDNGAVDDTYQNSFRQRTYFMAPRMELINNDWENYFMARVAPIARADHWKGVLAPPVLNLLDSIIIERPIVAGITSESYLKKHGQSRTDQNERQSSEMTEGHPGLIEDAKQSFTELLELFSANKVTVILYTPPYHRYYMNILIKRSSTEINKRLMRFSPLIRLPIWIFPMTSDFPQMTVYLPIPTI